MSVPIWYLLLSLVAGLLVKNPSGGLGGLWEFLKNLLNRSPSPTPSPSPSPGPVSPSGPSLLDLLRRLLDELQRKKEEVAQAEVLVSRISVQEATKKA